MHALRFALLSLLLLWSLAGQAADLALQDDDCASILERWAQDPDSVPRHLVDACKQQMSAAPVPPAEAAVAALTDPCTGPAAATSVLCWGPWSSLAPAAAPPQPGLEFPPVRGDCVSGSDIDDICVAELEPLEKPDPPSPPVVDVCVAGAPCGFATLVDGLTSTGAAEDTEFRSFDLAADGSSFTVDPGGADEIQSVTMDTTVTPRNDGFENMRARGRDGDDESRLIARVVREDGSVQLAADIWTDGNRGNSALNRSGYFAWGVGTSESALGLLNGQGISVAFSGPMSVDNATSGSMTVNFGSQPNWTGAWTNPGWSFDAGGPVNGVNLISTAGQFSSNVQADSVVQGALVGEPGRQAIVHLIDVSLADHGRIKDVGLLRQAATNGTGSVETISR
ncbi:MAG: hypothetical protein L6Q83_02305 [Gammaproteobacteria bacterium]|nr:hypothetical protein [Gammaproteobacteria bacterium]